MMLLLATGRLDYVVIMEVAMAKMNKLSTVVAEMHGWEGTSWGEGTR
jgi:hypothetical protein